MNASEVIQALKTRFAPPEYAFLEQVANGTGARQYRWADAMAMSVWPSRGFDIHGIEVKVSRYDWKKELSQPEKSAPVQQYCNRWWIVTPDEPLIGKGELPSTWGWMKVSGKGVRVVIDAPRLEPKAPTVEFLASILRNASKSDDNALEAARYKGYREAQEQAKTSRQDEYLSLKEEVIAFQKASGIELDRYADGEGLGQAVSTLRHLKWKIDQVNAAMLACEEIRDMLAKIADLKAIYELAKEQASRNKS
jgi:hypothetical protein